MVARNSRTPVTFACGHTEHRDLSTRRTGYARWLATRLCTRCRHTHHHRDRASTAAWIAVQRSAEHARIAIWEHQHRLPALRGTMKAVDWARRCRHTTLTRVDTDTEDGGATAAAPALIAAAKKITSASWWIEHRTAPPADLIAAAARARSMSHRPWRSP